MIDLYHASEALLEKLSSCQNEREQLQWVNSSLAEYQFATSVKHAELDIAFAAAGGPTQWVRGDSFSLQMAPTPARASHFGDILIERANDFAHLATPMGFIPLMDIAVKEQRLISRKESAA